MKKLAIMFVAFMAIAGVVFAENKTTIESGRNETAAETSTVEEDSFVVIRRFDNLSSQEFLSSIAQEFKGRVVLIHIWMHYCKLSHDAIKSIATIRPELSKKGCVFIYIPVLLEKEDINDPYWERMAKKYGGYHYFLNRKLELDFREHLGITGAPTNILLNKNGTISFVNSDGSVTYDKPKGGNPKDINVLKRHIEAALAK